MKLRGVSAMTMNYDDNDDDRITMMMITVMITMMMIMVMITVMMITMMVMMMMVRL